MNEAGMRRHSLDSHSNDEGMERETPRQPVQKRNHENDADARSHEFVHARSPVDQTGSVAFILDSRSWGVDLRNVGKNPTF